MNRNTPSSPDSDPSLLLFSALVAAAVCWVVVVCLLLPRLLGRALSFLANRAFRGTFHIVIPVLHIYPLAGRVVAHSLRYTVADATFSVEELVLQIRWWRKAPESQFRQLLVVDDANTLHPLARAQQELLRENSAVFAKRLFYRLRRWWKRSAGAAEASTDNEPPPLISLIAVGLRVRLVNMRANYEHVNRVLDLAKQTSARPANSRSGDIEADLPLPLQKEKSANNQAPQDEQSRHSTSSYSSEQSVDAKPFKQRVAELMSVRITSGAFYLCDMGESPLIRLVVDSAKIRYRYGAATCPIDECRKRLRVRMSGLHVSVADRETVQKLVRPVTGSAAPKTSVSMQDNTNRMIKRVLAMGYKGINDPYVSTMGARKRTPTIKKRPRALSTNSDITTPAPTLANERRTSFRYTSRANRREARRSQVLRCADLLVSETAVLDYVFDEPGPLAGSRNMSTNRVSDRTLDVSSEGQNEDTSLYPPPVCRVSMLLRGASFSYDTQAVADIERVIERIQPALYDLMPLAMRLQSWDAKRLPTGVQIEIDATPLSQSSLMTTGASSSEVGTTFPPLVSVQFDPRSNTWGMLEALRIRKWPDPPEKEESTEGKQADRGLPPSAIDIFGKHVSIRTEIPYRIGAQQRTVVLVKSAKAVARGVVDMPLCTANHVNVIRTLQFPRVWNDIHSSTLDVTLKDAEVTYVPDILRIIDDLVFTIQKNSKKPPDVRYFVPFKETTTIRAENSYKVILSCSHDNAWENIQSLQADDYGKVIVSGESAELRLSPNHPTEFLPEKNSLSWSLSLPNASGHLVLPLGDNGGRKRDLKGEAGARPSESDRSLLQRGRQPSLARRVRSQLETLAGNPHNRDNSLSKREVPTIAIDLVKAGKICELSGNVLINEDRKYLGSSLPLFLDSVDHSDLTFTASSIELDINPHHITNILNLTRNYAGRGSYVISTVERDLLHANRKTVTAQVFEEKRYPFLQECLTLGLSSGQALTALGYRRAMDELLYFDFHIDAALVKLHSLPHALCPFDDRNHNVLSIECTHLSGVLRSSLLGMDLLLSPEGRTKSLTVHCDFQRFTDIDDNDAHISIPTNLSAPGLTIEQFRVHKSSLASPDWGFYSSHLTIEAGKIFGCVPDYLVLCLVQFILAAVPHQLFEDQAAAAALLSVDGIELKLGMADVLVLSASSNAAAKRSGQAKKLNLLGNESSADAEEGITPMFLKGVAHLRAPVGARLLMSNLASERIATKTRLVIPDLVLDVLVSWGGKLTPWVDDATLRAQVAHAKLTRASGSREVLQESGPLRRAAELRETTLEIVFDSRPRTWSKNIVGLQRHHINRQSEKTRGITPSWIQGGRSAKRRIRLSTRDEVEVEWWTFLGRCQRATVLDKHIQQKVSTNEKMDSLSVKVITNTTILISPEALELVHDNVVRFKEGLEEPTSPVLLTEDLQNPTAEQNPLPIADIIKAWRSYETSRLPRWASRDHAVHGVLVRAVETEAVKIVLQSSLNFVNDGHHRESLTSTETGGESAFLSAPRGIQLLDSARTEILSGQRSSFQQQLTSAGPSVVHTRVIHAAVPTILVGCNQVKLSEMSRLLLIHGQRSSIQRNDDLHEHMFETHREDKNTFVAKISSLQMGRPVSNLVDFARLGRVSSIFLLLSRALALEFSSMVQVSERYLDRLSEKLFPISIAELSTMRPSAVRAHLAEVSNLTLRTRANENSRTNTVFIPVEHPVFIPEQGRYFGEKVRQNETHSIDIALRDLCLRLANEDIVRTNILTCKGGSIEKPRRSLTMTGLVLNASFGTVSLCIRDDIAANTLRMVSEVASYVHNATVSTPILRYEGSGVQNSGTSEYFLRGDDHVDNHHAQFQMPMDQPHVNQEHKQHGTRPIRNVWFSRSSRRSKGFAPGLRYSSNERAVKSRSQGANSWSAPSWESQPLSGEMTINFPDASSTRHEEMTGTATSLSLMNREGNTNSDEVLESRAQSETSHGVVSSNKRSPFTSRKRSQEIRWFDSESSAGDDKQSYAYVAIPTAVETGPPRKKAKARVRVEPVIPPAFSQRSHNASQNPTRPSEDPSPPSGGPEVEMKGMKSREMKPSIGEPRRRQQKRDYTRERTLPIRDERRKEDRVVMQHVRKRLPLTVFVSCREIVSRYYRRRSLPQAASVGEEEADISVSLRQPRVSLISEPSKGNMSVVVTTSSAELKSGNNPHCILTGSVSRIGVTISIVEGYLPTTLPKLIASARVSEFKTTLHATDLKSVLNFRQEFKADLKAVLSAFVTSRTSLSEMAKATQLSSWKGNDQGRSLFSTMAFDLLCENSMVKLEGFHPKDSAMCISYLMDGIFFSVVASKHDKAVLTLGLRLHGHGLCLSAPSWPDDENFHFPSLDARGVQWGEATGLPTLLKVSAEPLVNSTSIQGLRHVIFTVAGLMAFQNTASDVPDLSEEFAVTETPSRSPIRKDSQASQRDEDQSAGATPFTRSFAAWERTKGVRMDVSIRPMSISLASGQVVARFNVETITGIFEWNKLVRSGVQLHAAVGIPRISLMFVRMPASEFAFPDPRICESRASMSIALERSRLDILKTQEELTHTFIFRLDIFAVSGQLRPWRLLMDAAVWADEQEFVSDLQAINYVALSSSKQRTPKSPMTPEVFAKPLEHRIMLVGANVQRFKLAVPLLNTEEYSSSRLALRATELHLMARHRFDSRTAPQKNTVEVKTHFIGVLWENTALLSSHHARITLSVQSASPHSHAHFGAMQVVVVAGTWRICPRKDVVMAVLEAKNGKDNRLAAERSREVFASLPDVLSRAGSSVAGDSASIITEKHTRMLVESLQLKILQTSGFIEGLGGDIQPERKSFNERTANTARVQTVETSSKVAVPAFSIAVVRDDREDFDLIDVDFSGREGEFPRHCLQKVENLFSELFGAVASDQQQFSPAEVEETQAEQREISRDTSVLIRFGKSLYRAQEEAHTSLESRFCAFADKFSSLLVSLSTRPIFENEAGHTTVITGVAPRLGLEVTPMIEGADTQSLRLTDARVLHGVSPCRPPHTLIHLERVTALMDIKTLMLAEKHIQSRRSLLSFTDHIDESAMAVTVPANAERNMMVVMGRYRNSLEKPYSNVSNGKAKKSEVETKKAEAEIRIQVRVPLQANIMTDQVDVFGERLHFGACRTRTNPFSEDIPLNVHVALHELNVRAQWDIMNCKFRLRENLLSWSTSGTPLREGGSKSITNIMNRLHFESIQSGNHTMKLGVDALAAYWGVPSREVIIESTTVDVEVAHKLMTSIMRLIGQMKRLNGEVKLLVDREVSKDARRGGHQRLYSFDGRSADSVGKLESIQSIDGDAVDNGDRISGSLSDIGGLVRSKPQPKLKRTGKTTTLCIRGDSLGATLRGYQFEETQHSAMISLNGYDVNYAYSVDGGVHLKQLDIDFVGTKMTYNDDERGIHSDLFRIPSPELQLRIQDGQQLQVSLTGNLEVKLGPGFYHWQKFRELAQLTVNGITPVSNNEIALDGDVWDGRHAHVHVALNPRIDVIGGLTEDMLEYVDRKREAVRVVPKILFEGVGAHLEAMSEILCDILSK